jgi:hypothetical protein
MDGEDGNDMFETERPDAMAGDDSLEESNDSQVEQSPAPAAASAAPAPAPAAPTITPEALAQAMKMVQAPAPAAPQLTDAQRQEQLKKEIQYFEVGEDHIARIVEGGPEAVQALNEVLAKKTQQAVLMAHRVALQEINKFRESVEQDLGPMKAQHQQRQQEEAVGVMITEHPDLAAVKDRLPAIYDLAVAQGVQFPNDPQASRKMLAEFTRALVALPGKPGATTPPKKTPPTFPSGQVATVAPGAGGNQPKKTGFFGAVEEFGE